MRGNRTHLQSHCDEASWRMLRSQALLDAFPENIRGVHGQVTSFVP